MTDILARVEHTNWALLAWNSTIDRNDVPSAWLYGQDHLWATIYSHLVSSKSYEVYFSWKSCKMFRLTNKCKNFPYIPISCFKQIMKLLHDSQVYSSVIAI